jgi:hypothetical protein
MYATDACLRGGAAYFEGDWFFTEWLTDLPEYKEAHINVLELLTILESAKRWGALWTGRHILVRSDNLALMSAINKASSRSPDLLKLVKELFWLSVRYDFRLSASYLPGKLNILSNKLSRLHCLKDAEFARGMLVGYRNILSCKSHMSYDVYVSLQEEWSRSGRF